MDCDATRRDASRFSRTNDRVWRHGIEIQAAVRRLGADLLLIGRCGRPRADKSFVGSTAEFEIRNAKGPVLIVARRLREIRGPRFRAAQRRSAYGKRNMTSCGRTADGMACPPGPANCSETVARFYGVSRRK